MRKMVRVTLAAIACLLALPVAAYAQSAIGGVVKDSSGSVLPGVTVEAASPALIEKSKTVVTDGAGVYKIIDLRPGLYTLTFTLTGFQTVKQEQVELPADFTATMNANMKIGALEETLVVTGAAPIVDVQSAAHVSQLDADAIANLPTGRTIQGIGQMIPGVSLSLPDVGGSRAAMQTYMSVHGNSAANNTVMVDGMVVNGLEANGAVQSYFNDSMSQEMTYQTSGIDASVSSGGVKLNMVPREGGNRFSGNGTEAYRPGSWQGDNLSDRLQTAGLSSGNATEYIQDLSVSQGGPLLKDRLWFFATGRDYRTSNIVSNTFFTTGKKGDDYNYIRDGLGRLTWQVSSKNKITGYYDRISKYRAHDMQSFTEVDSASNVWTSPNYSTGSFKFTSTRSSRLLLDAGWAFNIERRDVAMQDGVDQTYGSDAWFNTVSKHQTGVVLGTVGGAPSTAGSEWPERYSYTMSASYVTGSHSIKVGMNGTYGKFFHSTHANGDLGENFANADLSQYQTNGIITFSGANTVTVRNTPVQSQENLSRDLGIYAQDSWKLRRLSLSAGLRWEYLNSQVTAMTAPAGRFVPARSEDSKIDLPNWKNWSPRVQAVYDPLGDGKTAIKYSFSKYDAAQTTSVAAGFNALGSKSAPVAWTDLNNDGIAQGARTWNADGTAYTDCVYLQPGCEINLAGQLSSNFGLLSDTGTYGGYPRQYSLEQSFELQREILPRLSGTFTYYRGSQKNQTVTVNRAVTPSDYNPVDVFNPVDGSTITIYNISAAANLRASDNFTFVDPDRKTVFDSYQAEFRARPGAGALIFGGMSWERSRSTNCTVGNKQNPNNLRFCDEFNLENDFTIPYQKNFRLNVSYPVRWGLILSGAWQNNDGGGLGQSYSITRASTRYPDGSSTYLAAGLPVAACPAPCAPGSIVLPTAAWTLTTASVSLRPGSSVRNERLNQIDLKIQRTFKFGRLVVNPTIEAFNITNQDHIITYASTAYAVSGGAYLRPNSILQGRVIGVGASVRW